MLHSGWSWVHLPPPSPGRSGTPALCGAVAAPTWSHYQVCQASAKLVPGPQYSGRNARAHCKHTSAFGAEMFGVGPPVGDGFKGADYAWDYSYSYSEIPGHHPPTPSPPTLHNPTLSTPLQKGTPCQILRPHSFCHSMNPILSTLNPQPSNTTFDPAFAL